MKIKTTKPYIIEGQIINENTIIETVDENRLVENRVNMNKNEFIQAVQKDEELNKFLHTNVKDLPEEYKYLLQEEMPNGDGTLFQLIDSSFAHLGDDKNFFSIKNSKITGWMAYDTDKTDFNVLNIKMCSLTPDKNNIELIKDLKDFLDFLLTKYKYIQWFASQANKKGNKIYEKVIEMYNGTQETVNSNLYLYTIKKQ